MIYFNFTPYGPSLSPSDISQVSNDNFYRTQDILRRNFDELDGRVTNLESPIYYNGDIQSEITATYKVLGPTREIISGLTKTNTTTLTVNTKGIYYIHMQQLIQAGANAGYFEIRINNNVQTYGYFTGNSFNDVPATILKELNVNDTIRVYQSVAITSSWNGGHSDLSIFCIKRT